MFKTLFMIFLLLGFGFCRASGAEEVQLQNNGNTYSIPVMVNGAITLNFILDTGASVVSIPADVVSTLLRTGTLASSDFLGTKGYTVLADGSKVPSLQFRLRQLRIGNLIVQNVLAAVLPSKGDPLLGQSFLSRLPPWTIDYPRHALVVGIPGAVPQVPAYPQAGPVPGSTTGGISRDDFIERRRQAAIRYGRDPTTAAVRAAQMFDAADLNHDGIVDANERAAFLAGHPEIFEQLQKLQHSR